MFPSTFELVPGYAYLVDPDALHPHTKMYERAISNTRVGTLPNFVHLSFCAVLKKKTNLQVPVGTGYIPGYRW